MSGIAERRRRFFVFQDESGEPGKKKYFIVGVLIVDNETRQKILDTVARVRHNRGFHEELHFTIMSKRRFPVYREIMAEVSNFPLHFCAMVIDNTKLRLSYFDNKRYLAYNRFCFLAIFHNIKKLHGDVYVYTDDKSRIKEDNFLEYLWDQLRFEAFARDLDYDIKTVEPRDSKQDELIQVTDLFLGAVNSIYNPPKNEMKRELAEMTSRMIQMSPRKFNIWEWTPKNRTTGSRS